MKNNNSLLNRSISKNAIILIALTVLTFTAFSIILVKIQLSLFILNLFAIFMLSALLVLLFSNNRAKRKNSRLTVIDYLIDLEEAVMSMKDFGILLLGEFKPYKRAFIKITVLLIALRYFTEPLLEILSTFIVPQISEYIVTLSLGIIAIVIPLLMAITLIVVTITVMKHQQIQSDTVKMNEAIESLNHLNVTLHYKHINGKRSLDIDSLLDSLIALNSEKSNQLYIQIKSIYKSIQYIEILPHEYKKKSFRDIKTKLVSIENNY